LKDLRLLALAGVFVAIGVEEVREVRVATAALLQFGSVALLAGLARFALRAFVDLHALRWLGLDAGTDASVASLWLAARNCG
jgi:hypothetical protein